MSKNWLDWRKIIVHRESYQHRGFPVRPLLRVSHRNMLKRGEAISEEGGRMMDVKPAFLKGIEKAKASGQPLRFGGAGLRRLDAGAESGSVLDSRTHLTQLIRYEPADLLVSIESGMTLGALNEALRQSGQWIPVQDWQLRDTVGGMIAAGMDTPLRASYGSMAQRVLALRAWTPGFGCISTGAPMVKNVAGYALGRLFWGSRGAFGMVTEVSFKVAPLPEAAAWWTTDHPDSGWFSSLQELGASWALMAWLKRGQRVQGVALWHGSRAMVAALEKQLGPQSLPPLAWPDDEAPYQLTGAVPLSACPSLGMDTSVAVDLLLERQSGWFLAQGSDLEALRHFSKRVEMVFGGAVALRGVPSWSRPFPKPMAPVYRRLRQQYDPEAMLVDPWPNVGG